MKGIHQKWTVHLLLCSLLALIFLNQFAEHQSYQSVSGTTEFEIHVLQNSENNVSELSSYKAKIFFNRKGLKKEINVFSPLREFNAIAKTDTETIEDLIEQISVWIPKLYREQFLVNPKCIIILETKLNNDGKAEVRFGVAMGCTPKFQLPNTTNI